MENGGTLLPLRAEIFFVVVALRKSSKFGEERRVRGFLTFAERTVRRIHCRTNAQRSRGGDLSSDLDRAIELLPGRRYELNKTHSVGLVGAPFIARQHVTHCIRPTHFADKSDRRATGREVTAGDFWLCEYGVACGNSDVGCEKKLVARALALALHGDNERLLSTRRYGADRIDELGSFREAAGTQDWRPAFGIKDAADKVGTLGVEDRDTESIIVIEHIHQTAQADNARQFDAIVVLPNAYHQN
jgi:hypothetical protein